MDRRCRWGRHLPGLHKIFNGGHQFTRCSDCDATLIATHKGWREVPPGKRVTWRARTPKDRHFTIMPNFDRARLKLDPIALFRRWRDTRHRIDQPSQPSACPNVDRPEPNPRLSL